jgi:hypothetical protein
MTDRPRPGLRIESDSENEAADPAKHLCVPMTFDPFRRQGSQTVMRADCHQVRKAHERAWERYEE